MEENIINDEFQYFSASELVLLDVVATGGTQVREVFYYLWVNFAKEDEVFEFIDKIELRFTNGKSVILAINDTDTGLTVLETYDFEADKKRIAQDFDGKILLAKYNALEEDTWIEAPEQTLLNIHLQQQDSGFLNRAVFLHFEEEKRMIYLSLENGLTVEFFEG